MTDYDDPHPDRSHPFTPEAIAELERLATIRWIVNVREQGSRRERRLLRQMTATWRVSDRELYGVGTREVGEVP